MADMKLMGVAFGIFLSGILVLIGITAMHWVGEELFSSCSLYAGIYTGLEYDCSVYGLDSTEDWKFMGGDADAPNGTEGVAYFGVILFIVDIILAVVLLVGAMKNRMAKVEAGLGVTAIVLAAITIICGIVYIGDADLDDGCIDGCPLTLVGGFLNIVCAIAAVVFAGFCCCCKNCGPAESVSSAEPKVTAVPVTEEG